VWLPCWGPQALGRAYGRSCVASGGALRRKRAHWAGMISATSTASAPFFTNTYTHGREERAGRPLVRRGVGGGRGGRRWQQAGAPKTALRQGLPRLCWAPSRGGTGWGGQRKKACQRCGSSCARSSAVALFCSATCATMPAPASAHRPGTRAAQLRGFAATLAACAVTCAA
jgi:hypothetical protein